MPQLKIQDALDAVESLATRVAALEKVLANGGVEMNMLANLGVEDNAVDIGEELDRLEKMITNLRRDVGKHVTIYNKHIMQQHKHTK